MTGTIKLRALAAVAAVAFLAARGDGQQTLTSYRTTLVGPIFQTWSFGDGVSQTSSTNSGTTLVKRATQWSIPVVVDIPFADRFALNVSTAYASDEVTLAGKDPTLSTGSYSVNGLTNTRIRLTGKLAGDNVVFTIGYNAPTGKTKLDPSEFEALRVIAAPALGFAMPTLGTGSGATAGLVLAKQLGSWAWALGGSYETRGSYAPVTVVAGIAAPNFSPSDAVHFSLATDGLLGQLGTTLNLSADVFTQDRLAEGAAPGSTTQLGPIFSADWELRLASARTRELTLYASDHYRTSYKRNETTVPESSGNYLDAGLRSVVPLSPALGFQSTLSLRHQTGLKSDNSLATAAMLSGGLMLGFVRQLGDGYSLQPFVRGEYGSIKTAGASGVNATGIAAGITFGRQF
jgi:hypothetical protein